MNRETAFWSVITALALSALLVLYAQDVGLFERENNNIIIPESEQNTETDSSNDSVNNSANNGANNSANNNTNNSTNNSGNNTVSLDPSITPIPNIIFESLNRSEIEQPLANSTGWISLDDHRGDIIILDLMAHDCSNCHYVQEHIENNMQSWHDMANASNKTLTIIAYGAWYGEDIPYLNQSAGSYHVPHYATGIGSTSAAILEDGSTTDPVRLFTTGGTGQIPVVLIIDEEGYIIEKQSTGTPTDGWAEFDGKMEDILSSNASDEVISNLISSRLSWEVVISSTADTPDQLALECLDHNGLARHDHVTLQIYIDDEAYTVESAVGIQTDICNGNENNMHTVHTHDDSGRLHVELNEPGDIALGVFFDIWGHHFDETGIFDYRINATHEIVMHVHSTSESATEENRVTSFDDYLLQNGEVIEIHFRAKDN